MKFLKFTVLTVTMLLVFVISLPVLVILFAISFWRMKQLAERFQATVSQNQNNNVGQGDCIDGEYQVISQQ